MLFYPLALVLLVWGAVALVRRHRGTGRSPDAEHEARMLRRTAFGAMAVSSAFVALFVVGETFSDPGGWEAVGLVAAWAVPLAVLGVVEWRHPDAGVRVLGVLVGLVLVASVWFAVDPTAWRDFEDAHGPVRTIATFAIAAALGLVGLRRPGEAGLELVVLALVPPLVASLGSRGGSPSLVAVATVPLLAGVLYLASALVERRGTWHPAH